MYSVAAQEAESSQQAGALRAFRLRLRPGSLGLNPSFFSDSLGLSLSSFCCGYVLGVARSGDRLIPWNTREPYTTLDIGALIENLALMRTPARDMLRIGQASVF